MLSLGLRFSREREMGAAVVMREKCVMRMICSRCVCVSSVRLMDHYDDNVVVVVIVVA